MFWTREVPKEVFPPAAKNPVELEILEKRETPNIFAANLFQKLSFVVSLNDDPKDKPPSDQKFVAKQKAKTAPTIARNGSKLYQKERTPLKLLQMKKKKESWPKSVPNNAKIPGIKPWIKNREIQINKGAEKGRLNTNPWNIPSNKVNSWILVNPFENKSKLFIIF